MSALSGGRNVCDFLLAHRASERPALIAPDHVCSHRELAERVEAAAAWIARQGVGPGRIVALVGDNTVEWVVWYLAALRAGAAAMPLCGTDSPRALHTALRLPELGLVLCQARYAGKVEGPLADRPGVPLRTDTAGPLWATGTPLPTRWPEIDPRRDLASVMMTSGSTGDPKGVDITHANLRANTQSILDFLGLAADDRMMVVLPFFYCFGLSLLHTHLRAGGALVLNPRSLPPVRVLDTLATRECTGFAGVPSTYQFLLRGADLARRPLPYLRHVQQAGGALAAPLLQELRQALPAHALVFVMYGATEATARLTYVPPERLGDKIGSVGVPIPGVTIRVCDENGRELPDGEAGELVADGANIARGYHGESGGERLRDGRFYTGDVGWKDADGFLWLVSRKASFIKSYGMRISPREVEDVICALPQVMEVMVVGVKDREAGEAIAAYVVAAPNTTLSVEQIRQHCQRHLPNQKMPQVIELRNELPKNAAGKLMRSQV
jgi:long-chain acyl-CoA synthetase